MPKDVYIRTKSKVVKSYQIKIQTGIQKMSLSLNEHLVQS